MKLDEHLQKQIDDLNVKLRDLTPDGQVKMEDKPNKPGWSIIIREPCKKSQKNNNIFGKLEVNEAVNENQSTLEGLQELSPDNTECNILNMYWYRRLQKAIESYSTVRVIMNITKNLKSKAHILTA